MKILSLLFAFLFLAFLSEPGTAQRLCLRKGGRCHQSCPKGTEDIHRWDCKHGWTCCVPRFGK